MAKLEFSGKAEDVQGEMKKTLAKAKEPESALFRFSGLLNRRGCKAFLVCWNVFDMLRLHRSKTMAKQKRQVVPILRIKKGDRLKTIYEKARRAFTAADLQKYTVLEEGIPAAQVLADLEAMHREETKKRKG